MSIIEIWVKTGETVERERTPEEQEQYEADLARYEAAETEAAAKKKAAAKAQQATITHAKSLGFTDAMIAVMYPNLGA
jgi:hypothetical protein